MNWIPHIMAAGQGDLSSPAAQELGHKYWQTSAQGHYIVDYAKYFSNLIALSEFLQVTQVYLRLEMLKADQNGRHQFTINDHIIRFNNNEGYQSFLKPQS
ncbi:hypothetical protein [Weissella hellenica]|uniref:Uncharacterized protein n=1 Tax=Weissella hellenica TaxID=46256 RepID=A0A4Y4G0C8_WEIHE|nr:hypothetical protein [Weissella hellenica]NKY66581.1 hypothetical protein [Weissella hellenica]GED35237.1 hypothetical protein WHE01_01410 [Weissella hellenica]SCB81677.1 hypothetical protein GA0061075_10338 [Weissella hellenica]